MEDLNAWVTTAGSWITVLKFGAWLFRKLAPKIRESLRQWRATHKR